MAPLSPSQICPVLTARHRGQAQPTLPRPLREGGQGAQAQRGGWWLRLLVLAPGHRLGPSPSPALALLGALTCARAQGSGLAVGSSGTAPPSCVPSITAASPSHGARRWVGRQMGRQSPGSGRAGREGVTRS